MLGASDTAGELITREKTQPQQARFDNGREDLHCSKMPQVESDFYKFFSSYSSCQATKLRQFLPRVVMGKSCVCHGTPRDYTGLQYGTFL